MAYRKSDSVIEWSWTLSDAEYVVARDVRSPQLIQQIIMTKIPTFFEQHDLQSIMIYKLLAERTGIVVADMVVKAM